MSEIMGLIHHLKDEEAAFQEIAKHRCAAAIPFGGRYRLVDFPLSNMVNADIANIGIVTSLKMRSLVDHLGRGEEWGLDRKRDGLFILPAASTDNRTERRVDLEDLYANLDYLYKSSQEYVLISGSNIVCNIDLRDVLAFHCAKDADITVVCTGKYRFLEQDIVRGVFLQKEKEGRITAVSPGVPQHGTVVSMDMYLMKRAFLLNLLQECSQSGEWDFASDVLQSRVKKMKIYGYSHEGYLALINSWQSLYQHQMELLHPEVWEELFLSKGIIHTKIKDGPPTRYCESADIKNVLAANGCLIAGKVENSILYRKVKIGRGAVIRNSILMTKVEVDDDVVLDGVILDKGVHVKRGTKLVNISKEPVLIEKNQEIGEVCKLSC